MHRRNISLLCRQSKNVLSKNSKLQLRLHSAPAATAPLTTTTTTAPATSTIHPHILNSINNNNINHNRNSNNIQKSAIDLSHWAAPVDGDDISYNVEQVFNAGMRQHHICNTAFPIAHIQTIKPYRVPRHRDQNLIRETLLTAYGDNLSEIMLYAHIPFCHTRCDFCEYTVIEPKYGRQDNIQDIYFNSLFKEIDLYNNLLQFNKKKLVGFDIGGGTPSMASEYNISKLMDKIFNVFGDNEKNGGDKIGPSEFYPAMADDGSKSMEISIETTPKIASEHPNKMKLYKKLGIDRISFGLQTTDFALAKKLGRLDANNDNYIENAVNNIRDAGFDSLNIDLMYGFPLRTDKKTGETIDKWSQTLYDTISLNPDHITLYRMRYKGTKMSHLADRVTLSQVNFQEQEARRILSEHGYIGWIGKNTYSKKKDGRNGCSDYLNHRVMNGIPYIGLGLGAQSYSHYSLSYNLGAVTKKMSQYIKSNELNRIPIQDLYHLSKKASAAKFISVSFYFGGIDINSFENIFGYNSFNEMYKNEIEFLINKKLMKFEILENKFKRFQMTVEGKKHFAGVVSLFYTPKIQNYLLGLGDKAAC